MYSPAFSKFVSPPMDYSSHGQEEEEEEEAFIGAGEGDIGDGEVLAVLQGQGMSILRPLFSAGQASTLPSCFHLILAEQEEDSDNTDRVAMEDDTAFEDDSIHTFEGHSAGVFAVAWNPARPEEVATGGGDDKTFVWRVGQEAFEQNRGAVLELRGHTDSITSLAYNYDGTNLATGSMDGTVKVWNADGMCIQTLEGAGEAVEWVQWHPKGGVVLAGADDFTAWMWLAASAACMQVFSGHSGPVTCGGFTPDGKVVVTGGGEGDGTLKIWDPKSGECKFTISGHSFHTLGLTCLDFSADSTVVMTGSEDGTAKLVSLQGGGRVVGTFSGHETKQSIEDVKQLKNLPLAVSAGLDGKLIVWDVATCTARLTCEHPDGVTKIALHPTEALAVSGCLDGGIRCWDLRTGECVKTFWGHTEAIQALSINSDGKMVLSGADDNSCRVFML